MSYSTPVSCKIKTEMMWNFYFFFCVYRSEIMCAHGCVRSVQLLDKCKVDSVWNCVLRISCIMLGIKFITKIQSFARNKYFMVFYPENFNANVAIIVIMWGIATGNQSGQGLPSFVGNIQLDKKCRFYYIHLLLIIALNGQGCIASLHILAF